MRDTRKTRDILVIGVSAALGAILGERFIKPLVTNTIKK